MTARLTPAHERRLRELWRSAGWPCQDMLELELLAAGLLERRWHEGRETLRLTDAGVARLADTLVRNRARRDAHEALVARVAQAMQQAGRLAWRGLTLRAKVGEAWCMTMPDVYSIRHTTVEDYVEPVVHEVKVRRADLLADLKRPGKGAAYRFVSSQCWYVLAEGIAQADEIPPDYGVMVAPADGGALDVLRAAPRRPCRLPLGVWMALARATPLAPQDEAQAWLGDESQAQPPSF